MPDKKFELGDYIEVKDRIAIFYELYPQGRLVTERIQLTKEPDDVPRVLVEANAYRTPDDPHPGTGWSWMVLPGKTPYTNGSELENTETSAWGRAIASLGILIDRSIASAQEVQNKQPSSGLVYPDGDGPKPRTVELEGGEIVTIPDRANPDGSLIGTVEKGKAPADMETRQTPDGPVYGFKLKDGRTGYQVLATGPLAGALVGLEAGTRVQVWGVMQMVPWDKGGKAMPPFARIALSRIVTPEFEAPAPGPVEAEPESLWVSPDEAAAILAAEEAEALA